MYRAYGGFHRDLYALFGTTLAGFVLLGTVLPVIPAHLKELGATPAEVGLCAMFLQLAFSVFQAIGGYCADRFGPRFMLVWPALLYPVFYTAGAVAPSIGWLVVFLVLGNVLIAMQFPAMLALVVARSAPEQRGRAFTLLEFTFGAGTGIGALIGFYTLKRWPFTTHLLVAGWFQVAVMLARALLIRKDGAVPAESPTPRAALRAILALDPRHLAGILLLHVVLGAAIFGPFYALYAKTELGHPENEIALLLGIGNLVATFGSLFLGRLADRAGGRTIAWMVVLHAGLVLPWLQLDFVSGLPFFALAFLAGQLLLIAFQAHLSRQVPAGMVGSVFGIINTCGGVFLGLAPAVFAALAARYGTARTPFHLAFLFAALTAWCYTRCGERRVE